MTDKRGVRWHVVDPDKTDLCKQGDKCPVVAEFLDQVTANCAVR